ncbi:hypothetical protein ABOONEI_526 [Aciduliprofundum boonei T469]|nr:hypothetical protein ABOONEI_526 [Aciduliprofundum boonei T469]
MEDVGTIERLYKKLDEIEDKIEEIRLALIPEEEPTEEELKIIKEGREEINKGQYVKLEDALEILDE